MNRIPICINDDKLDSVDIMEVTGLDKNNNKYTLDVYYLGNSVRFKLEELAKFNMFSLSARNIYVLILSKLKNNTNVINISRKEIKTVLNVSDSLISRSIKELIDGDFIELIDKDTYSIPINKVYKGNINKMISLYKNEQEKLKQLKLEEESKNAIEILSNNNKNRHKLKSKNYEQT